MAVRHWNWKVVVLSVAGAAVLAVPAWAQPEGWEDEWGQAQEEEAPAPVEEDEALSCENACDEAKRLCYQACVEIGEPNVCLDECDEEVDLCLENCEQG